MRKEHFLIVGVIAGSLLLIVGLGFLGGRPRKPIEDVTAACVQHAGIGVHIHAHLRIVIDGAERPIPADIGIVGPRCMRPLHTHDASGTLHLEFPVAQEVRLGQFFTVWEQPFAREKILDRTGDDTHQIILTVNGQPSDAYENLILHDKDDIVIEFRAREAPGGSGASGG